MKDISWLYRTLSPEQLEAMEGVLLQREQTLESFKLMRKKYTRIRSRIKAIEKKLMNVLEQEGDHAFVSQWIMREVASIENKYKDIEHAIKHYNEAMKTFNDQINTPHFRNFRPQEVANYSNYSPVNHLKEYLYSADRRMRDAMDAMRITERYFKNITSAFKSHAELLVVRKQAKERAWRNEMKNL